MLFRNIKVKEPKKQNMMYMEILFDKYVLAFIGLFNIRLLWWRLWGHFKAEDGIIS